MAESSSTCAISIKEFLDKALKFHEDTQIHLKKQIEILEKEKCHLRETIQDIANEKDSNKQQLDNLSQEVQYLKLELKKERSLNHQLGQKLIQERTRVLGWKQKALNSKKDYHGAFLEPKEKKEITNVKIYAPMTEQHSDEKEDQIYDQDVFISVGETEHVPNDVLLVNSDTDEGEPSSPSVLSKCNTMQSSKRLMSSKQFETSDDLFAETASPFRSKSSFSVAENVFAKPLDVSCKQRRIVNYEKDEVQIISGKSSKAGESIINPLKAAGFTSSTPIPSNNKSEKSKTLNEKMTVNEKDVKEKNKVNYKYVEVIKNKAEREKLRGFTCHECEQFYANENLGDDQRKEIIDRCSRHRHRETPPPSTPDDFWAVSFPSTQDYVARGLMEIDKTQAQKENKLSRERTRKRIKYQ